MLSNYMTIKHPIVAILFVSASLPAYGYIDPGTGSLIIQGIIGAIAAAGVMLKIYWHKVRVFFSRGQRKAHLEEPGPITPVDDSSE